MLFYQLNHGYILIRIKSFACFSELTLVEKVKHLVSFYYCYEPSSISIRAETILRNNIKIPQALNLGEDFNRQL